MTTFIYNPLEQFDHVIISIFYHEVALTNFTIMMLINFSVVTLLLWSFKSALFLNSIEFINFTLYNVVKTILKQYISIKNYAFIFLFFFLFLFILVSNLIGLTPYSITITSHLIFTLYYSLAFFIGTNLIGFLYQRENYFSLFLPDDIPLAIIPLFILIEYLGHFSKILTLSIRLFANMMSGHILLKILIKLVWSITTAGSLWMILSYAPLGLIFCVTGLECMVAFLQTYIFFVLLSLYLNDVINLH